MKFGKSFKLPNEFLIILKGATPEDKARIYEFCKKLAINLGTCKLNDYYIVINQQRKWYGSADREYYERVRKGKTPEIKIKDLGRYKGFREI